ncbi:MAG: right-handed parallel beta-helix repeat-containing protein [Phycisphaerae bacterium]
MSGPNSAKLVSVLVVVLSWCGPVRGQVIHVRADAAPGGDGATWATAYHDLALALREGVGGEVWVAAGVYRPDEGTGDRARSFLLNADQPVYGGFAGVETQRDQRDWVANETILSGDLLGDDGPDFANRADNSQTIVSPWALEGTTVTLDGSTVRGSYPLSTAGDSAAIYSFGSHGPNLVIRNCLLKENRATYGGAILHYIAFASPILTVENCRFTQNQAETGGAMYFGRSVRATVRDCVFEDNTATASGGAVYMPNIDEYAISRCVFRRNRAAQGGAVESSYALYLASMVECSFEDNVASQRGGAVAFAPSRRVALLNCRFERNRALDGGAISIVRDFDFARVFDVEITNSRFNGNVATGGGGAVFVSDVRGRPGQSRMALVNSTLTNNAAAGNAGGVIGEASVGVETLALTLANNILWNNTDSAGGGESAQIRIGSNTTAAVDYCTIDGLTGALGGMGNLGANPRFRDSAGPDGMPGTPDDDLRLQYGSPCLDAGSNLLVPADSADLDNDGNTTEPTPLDLTRYARFRDDPAPDSGAGPPPITDMGAYERRAVGDMDCDGLVNNFDVDPFVLALAHPDVYAADYPNCDISHADVNDDHHVDNFDIDAFIRVLLHGA